MRSFVFSSKIVTDLVGGNSSKIPKLAQPKKQHEQAYHWYILIFLEVVFVAIGMCNKTLDGNKTRGLIVQARRIVKKVIFDAASEQAGLIWSTYFYTIYVVGA